MTPTETVAEFLSRSANNGYENRPQEYGYEESCSRGGVSPGYFQAIAPDPTDRDIQAIREQLRSLTSE